MAVEQNGLGTLAWNFDEDQWRTVCELHDLERGAVDCGDLVARPTFEQLDRIAHITMRGPVGIEGRRFVRNADIFGERGYNRIVPDIANEGFELCGVHGIALPA